MALQVKVTEEGRKLLVECMYSPELIEKFRGWAGKWNKKAWELPASRKPEIVELFGENLSDTVLVRVPKDKLDEKYQSYLLGGYRLAYRASRDRGAEVDADLVAGTIPSSGGSVKHPAVSASDDAVFEIEVARDFAMRRGLEIIDGEATAFDAACIADKVRELLAGLTDEQVAEVLAIAQPINA